MYPKIPEVPKKEDTSTKIPEINGTELNDI